MIFVHLDKLLQLSLTVTSLLKDIAFQSSINEDLPEIGFDFYVDKLSYIPYF